MLETTKRIETVEANIGALHNFKLYDFAGNFDLFGELWCPLFLFWMFKMMKNIVMKMRCNNC